MWATARLLFVFLQRPDIPRHLNDYHRFNDYTALARYLAEQARFPQDASMEVDNDSDAATPPTTPQQATALLLHLAQHYHNWQTTTQRSAPHVQAWWSRAWRLHVTAITWDYLHDDPNLRTYLCHHLDIPPTRWIQDPHDPLVEYLTHWIPDHYSDILAIHALGPPTAGSPASEPASPDDAPPTTDIVLADALTPPRCLRVMLPAVPLPHSSPAGAPRQQHRLRCHRPPGRGPGAPRPGRSPTTDTTQPHDGDRCARGVRHPQQQPRHAPTAAAAPPTPPTRPSD